MGQVLWELPCSSTQDLRWDLTPPPQDTLQAEYAVHMVQAGQACPPQAATSLVGPSHPSAPGSALMQVLSLLLMPTSPHDVLHIDHVDQSPQNGQDPLMQSTVSICTEAPPQPPS